MTSAKLTKQQLMARVAELERLLGALREALEQRRPGITARRPSEEQYRVLLETIHDMVWEVDDQGIFRYVSPTSEALLGYRPEELVGRSSFDFMTSEDAPQHRALFKSQLSAGKGMRDILVEMQHKDGRRVVHEVNIVPLFGVHGKCCGFHGTIRDVTDRSEMEQSLRQSHQELQAIYDGVVDGLLIADVENLQLLRANQAICRMLGYTERELVSLTVRDIHPPDKIDFVLGEFTALVVGKIFYAENIPMLRKDGSVFYTDVTRNVLQFRGRYCIMGFFRDNTERRQAAQALNREHQVLRQLLKSHDRDRKIIAYEIHDGVAQLLAGAIMQFETYQEMCRHTPRAAEQGGNVVGDLLRQCHAEVRRLISGLRPPVLDEFGVVATLQHSTYQAIAQWGTNIEYHHDVDFDRLEPSLESAIYRIAQESLTNACQHSHSDRIRMELTQHGPIVRISVQDWGTGFDPQRTDEKCFGLAGIRQRARLLGGHVSLTTRPGEGSHIVVELPLNGDSEEVPGSAPAPDLGD